MISFRTVDGSTHNDIDKAIAYETERFRSSLIKQKRGKGSPTIFKAIRDNLKLLKSYKKSGFVLLERKRCSSATRD